MPPETSHISCVQTPVKARGKKSRTGLRLPKLSLSLTSSRPWAVLLLRGKSGALVPILRGIGGGGRVEVRRKKIGVGTEVCQRLAFAFSGGKPNSRKRSGDA